MDTLLRTGTVPYHIKIVHNTQSRKLHIIKSNMYSQGLQMVNKAKAKGESCVDKVVLLEWVNGLHTALRTRYSMNH